MIPRYRTWVFHGMKVCWKQNSAGMTERRLVNSIACLVDVDSKFPFSEIAK